MCAQESTHPAEYVARLRAALEFYADPKHWESVLIEDYGDGHQTWESGPALDGGASARAALTDGTVAESPHTTPAHNDEV